MSRNAEVKKFRAALAAEVGRCEICHYDLAGMKYGEPLRSMHQHEIARGPFRAKARDKRYAVLWLCESCHMLRIHGNEDWPEARQLAVLMASRSRDYSLKSYNALVNPNAPRRIEQTEVDSWREGE